METNEKMLFSNLFGSVTDRRVILNYKKGTEDLPVAQITSVGYQHSRNYIFSIGNFLISIGGFVAMLANINEIQGLGVLIILMIIILALLSGIANWIGHHYIQISAGGMDRKPLKVEMSKTKEGRDFVNAVKKVVIK